MKTPHQIYESALKCNNSLLQQAIVGGLLLVKCTCPPSQILLKVIGRIPSTLSTGALNPIITKTRGNK